MVLVLPQTMAYSIKQCFNKALFLSVKDIFIDYYHTTHILFALISHINTIYGLYNYLVHYLGVDNMFLN